MRKSGLLLLATSLMLGTGSRGFAAGGGQPSATERNRAIITEYARMRELGETYKVEVKYTVPNNIEHNPEIGEGITGDKDFLEKRRLAHPEKYDTVDKYVNVVQTIVADGDLVAVKSHLFASAKDPGREFVDMWRIKNGKFVEHWDIIAPISKEAVERGLLACGSGMTYAAAKALKDTADHPTCGNPDKHANRVANRKLVLDYMKLVQVPGKQAKAVNTYVARDLVQHTATVPAGRKALLDYLSAHEKAWRADHRTQTIRHVIADGDMVMVHSWVTTRSDPRGTVYLDLFRVKHGKIAEHWDIVEPVPAYSAAGRSMTGGPDTPLEPNRHKRDPDL